jgi:hypothetical protein
MQKPLTLLACGLLLTPLLGARASRHIHETVDPYSGEKTLTLDVDTRGCHDDPSTPTQVKLLISATERAPHDVVYNLTTDLAYGPTIHPDKIGIMDTLIDGLPAQLQQAAPKSKWREHNAARRGHHMREMIPYDVSLEYLDSLAVAKQFQFRINGQDLSLQRCASARQLRDLHEFLDDAAAY